MKDEDIQMLKEIGERMNTQDNRSTAFPLFVVQSLVQRPSPAELSTGCERVDDDHLDRECLCEKCNALYENDEELPDECEDCQDECFNFFTEEYEFDLQAGVFLTEQACEEHIKYNGYHYYKPRSYAVSAWRNNEMQNLMKMLSVLASKDGKVTGAYL